MKKLLLFIFLFISITPLWAGISPKPEMDFVLHYQTESKPAIRPDTSEQIQCEDNQCIQSQPLGEYGIQKLYCRPDGCFSIAYEYKPFQKLVLDFSDGVVRQSNVFRTPAKLRNSFTVHVRGTDLWIEPSPQPQNFNALLRADAWASLIIILIMEIIAALAYLMYTGKSFRVLYGVILVNLISMPLSWQVLGWLVPEPWFIWLFCFLFEAFFIWIFCHKHLTFKEAAVLSLAMNVTSYSVGMIISFLLAPYLF